MKKICLLAALMLAFTAPAFASTITYSAVLVSPSANPADPGWYNGTGNPNGGFTVVNDNGIEIGLRAKGRMDPNVINSATNVYDVPAGSQVGVPTRAWWNYEFSVDLRPKGIGSLVLGDIGLYSTMVLEDVTAGKSATIPLGFFYDDATWGVGGEHSIPALNLNDWGMQNSENGEFANNPLEFLNPGYAFDMNAEHLYRFGLNLRDNNLRSMGSNEIFIRVGNAPGPGGDTAPVPEPASVSLLGTGLALAGFVAHRRRKAATNLA